MIGRSPTASGGPRGAAASFTAPAFDFPEYEQAVGKDEFAELLARLSRYDRRYTLVTGLTEAELRARKVGLTEPDRFVLSLCFDYALRFDRLQFGLRTLEGLRKSGI